MHTYINTCIDMHTHVNVLYNGCQFVFMYTAKAKVRRKTMYHL